MKLPPQFGGHEIITTQNDKEGVLTKVSSSVEESDFSFIKRTLVDLHKFVSIRKDISGIALPQIGINKRGFVMCGKTKSGKSYDIIAINPVILEASPVSTTEQERCLSEPGVVERVTRPISLRVQYVKTDGTDVVCWLQNYVARVFLHEYDHLDGILLSTRK